MLEEIWKEKENKLLSSCLGNPDKANRKTTVTSKFSNSRFLSCPGMSPSRNHASTQAAQCHSVPHSPSQDLNKENANCFLMAPLSVLKWLLRSKGSGRDHVESLSLRDAMPAGTRWGVSPL